MYIVEISREILKNIFKIQLCEKEEEMIWPLKQSRTSVEVGNLGESSEYRYLFRNWSGFPLILSTAVHLVGDASSE